MGNSTLNSSSLRNETLEEKIKLFCEQEVWQFPDDRRCVYDLENFAKYLDYVYTIAFTIGK